MKTKPSYPFLKSMSVPVLLFILVAIVAGTNSAATQETDTRSYHASDGSTLKLIENSLMSYESWSGGHMCHLQGRLTETPNTQTSREYLFIAEDNLKCKGALQFLDTDGDRLTFYTNGQCSIICGVRNPPPILPLELTANR